MSQYRVGKASVAQGAQIVTFTGASLLNEQMVVSNNLFSFQGENVWYQIVNVAVLSGNLVSVTLATPYAGADKTDQSFAIHRDFSTNLALPIANYGDVNVAPLYQQSMTTLDSALGALGAYSGPLSGVNSATWTLRKNVLSPIAEDAGLLIHREGQSPLSFTFTGSQPWKRWSVGSQDLEVGGRLAVGREPVSTEKAAIAGDMTVDGDMTVMGQLYVRGETLILDVSNVEVEDPVISVARGNSGVAPYLGIKGERGASDAYWVFDEATDRWCAYLSGDELTTKSFGSVQAATFYGALSGNASTATKLATSRNIVASGDATGTAAFDGSANAALALTLANTGVGAGTYTKITVDSKGRVTAGTSVTALDLATVLGYTPVDPIDATTANTPNKIVKRDASGNIAASEITGTIIKATQFQGDLLGTAQAAGKLYTARTVAISGDMSGSVSFDGTSNVTIPATLANSGVTAGTYNNLIIDSKGRVIAARALTTSDINDALGYTAFSASGGTVNGSMIVTGDLTVQGTLTQVNTTEISVDDPILTVAKSNATAVLPFAGIKVERGGSDAFMVWDESVDRFVAYTSNDDLSTKALGNVQAATFYGALSGNASTATKLATARSISGVSFDGSADITLTTSNVGEGSNQYFTAARARSSITVTPGGSLAYDPVTGVLTSTIAEGTGPVWTVAGKDGHVSLDIADIQGLTTALAGKLDNGSAVFSGSASVRGSASFGYVMMASGNAERTGYVAFHTSDEIRRGYIGWKADDENSLQFAAENGWGWKFSGAVKFDTNPTVAGSAFWHAGNFDPNSKANSSHAHDASAITSGTIADGRMPERLNWNANQSFTDWNDAKSNGFWMSSTAANSPNPGEWFIGTVIVHNGGWVVQEVCGFSMSNNADTRSWRREQRNGVWDTWQRVLTLQNEMDARYPTYVQSQQLKTSSLVTGGGTISVSAGGRVKWTDRFITIALGGGGWTDINMPTPGSVISCTDGTTVTSDGNGIPLETWASIWFDPELFWANGSGLAHGIRIIKHNSGVTYPNPNWVCLCRQNGGDGKYHFPNGVTLFAGHSRAQDEVVFTNKGGTIWGDTGIYKSTGDNVFTLTAPKANYTYTRMSTTDGFGMWDFGRYPSVKDGSNSGGDFFFHAWNDDGTFGDWVTRLQRADRKLVQNGIIHGLQHIYADLDIFSRGSKVWTEGSFNPATKASLNTSVTFADVTASRGDGTGVIYLNAAGTRYVYFDGADYQMPGATLYVGGNVYAGGRKTATEKAVATAPYEAVDLNTLTTALETRFINPAGGNTPNGGLGYYLGLGAGDSAGRAAQMFMSYDDLFFRTNHDGWRGWRKVFNDGNHSTFGGKNYLINGCFRINQRGASGGVSSGGYLWDRWYVINGSSLTVNASYVATLNGTMQQPIELPDLAGKVVTVSVEDPSANITVYVGTYDGSTMVSGNITAGSGRRSVTLTVPTQATGHVLCKLVTAASTTFKNVQLERGSVASEFERRFVGDEYRMCQRYYCTDTNNYHLFPAPNNTFADVYPVRFPVVMRAVPTINYGHSAVSSLASSAVLRITQQHFDMLNTATANTNISAEFWFTANAEL